MPSETFLPDSETLFPAKEPQHFCCLLHKTLCLYHTIYIFSNRNAPIGADFLRQKFSITAYNSCEVIDFLGNFRSTVLLISFASGFVSLPCITPSSAAPETLFPAQNIRRNTALLRFPRKSIVWDNMSPPIKQKTERTAFGKFLRPVFSPFGILPSAARKAQNRLP